MKAYLAHIQMNLRLTFRDKTVLFFNYLFPLMFFFIFAQAFHAEQGGVILEVTNMVLVIGVLGTGFFGAGMRSVVDREQNILRRFKVAPVGPTPILISSLVTGLAHYIPVTVLVLVLAHFGYGMAVPQRLFSLFVFLSLGVLAFRSLGGIIAAVVNSMAESQILIQLLYFPMLFLSGATFPIGILPNWVQVIAQFLPATSLFTGMQSILSGREGLVENRNGVFTMLATIVVGTFLAAKLFRWEKEEKMRNSAKLWLLAVFGPFLILGAYQAYTREGVAKAKVLDREMSRSRTLLVRDARIFVGDGTVIERGSVLIRNGKIAEIFTGSAPDAKSLKAEAIEAAGKTLMPGLIDVHVHLSAPGGFYEKAADYQSGPRNQQRALAAYLYSGVIAVKSVGDPLDAMLQARQTVNSGEKLGAELFVVGPMFTAPGGHGTEYSKYVPEQYRAQMEAQTVRLPATPDEARKQVDDLKKQGVDGIKAILEAGWPGWLFNRMDVSILRAVAEEARAQNLPIVVHTGTAQDVADSLNVGVNGLEHGSARDSIPDAAFDRMKQSGVSYDPTLVVQEAFQSFGAGKMDPLDRSLVQQVGPMALIQGTKKMLASDAGQKMSEGFRHSLMTMEQAKKNLLRAWQRGVMLVTGSDAGNLLVLHGPAVHRELQLWVEAGIPPLAALQAATYNSARLLRADNRIGLIRQGYEASVMLVDGNPLADISATERISVIIFKGERIRRTELFDQD